MQLEMFEVLQDHNYTDKRVAIGLSGGINSAAVLCYLVDQVQPEDRPNTLHLFYAHFSEHSPDTYSFVLACVDFARKHFNNVVFETTNNSMNRFCTDSLKSIPPPQSAACTRILKIEPMMQFMAKYQIDVDLVGYVREEKRRITRQQQRLKEKLTKQYPIQHLSNEDCFNLVKKHIGWYPEIYNIFWTDPKIKTYIKTNTWLDANQKKLLLSRANRGYGDKVQKRVFGHNNCLPCKNMQGWELALVECFYPALYNQAMQTACKLNKYWGRKGHYSNENTSCTWCAFD